MPENDNAILTVGNGPGEYATLSAAIGAASDDDVINVTIDFTESGGTIMGGAPGNPKSGLTVNGNGHTVTFSGGSIGPGYVLWDMHDFWVHELNLFNQVGNRGGEWGAGWGLEFDCSYVLITDSEISYFVQAGVNTNAGPSRNYEGSEFLWVDNCYVHHCDVLKTFNNSGSLISMFHPQVVPNVSAPTRWTERLTNKIRQVWADGQSRDITKLTFIVQNCDLRHYDDYGPVIPGQREHDTDNNALIADDWVGDQQQFGLVTNYCVDRQGPWLLWENNTMYDIYGSAGRIYTCSDNAHPCKHVIRNNTSVNAGQRDIGGIYGSAFSITMAGDCNDGPLRETTHQAAVYNNVMIDADGGFATGFCGYNNPRHTVWVNNQAAWDMNISGGEGVTVSSGTALQAINSLTDPDLFTPVEGTSPLIAAGAAGPAFDKNGAPRDLVTPTIGAYETTAASIGPGTVDVASTIHQDGDSTTPGEANFSIPTDVADGDMVLVLGATRSSNGSGAGAASLDLTGTGFTEIINPFTPSVPSVDWGAECFAFYKIVAASEADDVITFGHIDGDEVEFDLSILRVTGVDGADPIGDTWESQTVYYTGSLPINSPGDVDPDGAVFWVAGITGTAASGTPEDPPSAAARGTLVTHPNWDWNSLAYSWRSYGASVTMEAPAESFTLPIGTLCQRGAFVVNAGAAPAAPVADFTYVTDDLVVDFTDTTTGQVSGWSWDFDDGSPVSTDQNPQHVFPSAGSYDVTLTATGPGGSDPETKTVVVTGAPVETQTRSAAVLLLFS